MELRLGGATIPVDKLGPGYFVSRESFDHPPAVGELSLSIDGQERRWPVDLFEGMAAAAARTSFRPLSEEQVAQHQPAAA